MEKDAFFHAKGRFISLDFQDSLMELDQKIRFALLAFTAVSIALSGFGLHVGVHVGVHLKALDPGGIVDR
jgi:hypothetical protein